MVGWAGSSAHPPYSYVEDGPATRDTTSPCLRAEGLYGEPERHRGCANLVEACDQKARPSQRQHSRQNSEDNRHWGHVSPTPLL